MYEVKIGILWIGIFLCMTLILVLLMYELKIVLQSVVLNIFKTLQIVVPIL